MTFLKERKTNHNFGARQIHAAQDFFIKTSIEFKPKIVKHNMIFVFNHFMVH